MRLTARAEFRGGGGDDILEGGPGADLLFGGDGDDTLLAGAGGDTLEGGAGDDTARFAPASTAFAFGLGDDGAVLLRNLRTREITELDPSLEFVAFANGAAEFDDIRSVLQQAEPGTVVVTPEAPAAPSQAADFLLGGAGADRIAARRGDDRVEGGGGGDRLNGGPGADTLLGGAGADRLDGGAGADRLLGGAGADTLIGGDGADAFVLAAGAGRDRIEDFGRGADRIEFLSGPGAFEDLAIRQRGEDVLIRFAGGAVLVEGAEAAAFDAADFIFA